MANFNPIKLGAGEAGLQIGEKFVIKIFPFTNGLMHFFQPDQISFDQEKETPKIKEQTLRTKNESLIILYLSRIDKDIKSSIVVPGTIPLVVAAGKSNIPRKFISFLDGYPGQLEDIDNLSTQFNLISGSRTTISKLRDYLPGGKGVSLKSIDKKYVWIFLVSPRVVGNGFDFVNKHAGNSEMIKEFLVVVLLKLQRLHEKYGIIHGDAKLTNVLYDNRVKVDYPGLKHFHYPIYFTDFEWSVSLQTIYGYEVTNYIIQHKNDEKRIMVPRIVGDPDYGLGKWNHGFKGIKLSDPKHRKLTEYLPGGIIPRCFAIDSLYLVHSSFRHDHIPDRDIQRIFHQWFADFRKISMADKEIRYTGKIDYASVDAKKFAEMFYPDEVDVNLVFKKGDGKGGGGGKREKEKREKEKREKEKREKEKREKEKKEKVSHQGFADLIIDDWEDDWEDDDLFWDPTL